MSISPILSAHSTIDLSGVREKKFLRPDRYFWIPLLFFTFLIGFFFSTTVNLHAKNDRGESRPKPEKTLGEFFKDDKDGEDGANRSLDALFMFKEGETRFLPYLKTLETISSESIASKKEIIGSDVEKEISSGE